MNTTTSTSPSTPFIPTAEELARFQQQQQPRTPACVLPGVQPPRAPLAPCVITAAQLKVLKIPRRPALLDRWLCEGDLGYIFAPRGVGKTWMAMALPGAISRRCALGLWTAGVPAPASASAASYAAPTADDTTASSSSPPCLEVGTGMELEPVLEADFVPVLYVDGEMALELTQYRSEGLQLDLGHVCYLHHEHLFQLQDSSLNIGELADREAITKLLLEDGYKVLILDNLSSLASGVDENKGSDYEPISHWLLELRRRRITVIVIHHAGRNGFMRGHSKREDACSWILELRDARQEDEPGAKFVSHFTKPSRNTGDSLPDLLWHFTSDAAGHTQIHCETAQTTDYEQFIQHVVEGVTSQHDIAEMMNKNKGTISKWARRALEERRISGSPTKLNPPKDSAKPSQSSIRTHASDDDFDDDEDDL
jgi:hypothetical protein